LQSTKNWLRFGFGAKQGRVICGISLERGSSSQLFTFWKPAIVPNKTTRPKNALAHGLYASDLVLAWENEQDFVDLYQSIR
jgi:hypothetical protein